MAVGDPELPVIGEVFDSLATIWSLVLVSIDCGDTEPAVVEVMNEVTVLACGVDVRLKVVV